MKTVAIFYFSGTGNTKKVSELLQKQFEAHDVKADMLPIEDLNRSSEPIKLKEYDMIGLAYPIYGLGTPTIIYDFINNLPKGSGTKLFILKTGADYISLNHNASIKVIENLEKKDYSVFYDRIIVMPSNWLLKYDDTLIKQLAACAEDKARHMCSELMNLKKRRYKTGSIMKFIALGIAHLERKYGSKYYGRLLRADISCNLCNLCVSNCPVDNIVEENGSLKFMDKCNICMRCIYLCPKNAIKSKGFNFTILKGGYNLEKVLEDKSINSNYITVDTKGYFKHFYKYIVDESL